MRYVCHVYENGVLWAYETTDKGFTILRTLEGECPEQPFPHISAYAEITCDGDEAGKDHLQQAMDVLWEVVRKEGEVPFNHVKVE